MTLECRDVVGETVWEYCFGGHLCQKLAVTIVNIALEGTYKGGAHVRNAP